MIVKFVMLVVGIFFMVNRVSFGRILIEFFSRCFEFGFGEGVWIFVYLCYDGGE